MATFNYKQLVEQVKREATDVIKGGLGEIDFNNIFRDTVKKLNINLEDWLDVDSEQLSNILSKSIASAFNSVDINKLSKKNPLSAMLSGFENQSIKSLKNELNQLYDLRLKLEDERSRGTNNASEINEITKKFVVLNTYLREAGVNLKGLNESIDSEFQDLISSRDYSGYIQMTKEYIKQLQAFDKAIYDFEERSVSDFSEGFKEQIEDIRKSVAKGEIALKDALNEISSKITFKVNTSADMSPVDVTQLKLANEELSKEIELLKERNKVLSESQDPYKQLLTMLGGKGKKFISDNFSGDISNIDNDLKQVLSDVNLINKETGKLKPITEGNTNKGGFIGDDTVALFRNIKDIDKSFNLKSKLDAAYAAGVNVARILNIVQKEGSDVFLEIQEKAKGNIIGEDYKFLNFDFLKATDEELKKLYEDVEKLGKLNLGLDFTLSNIFYEEGKGFSFIDVSEGSETMEEFVSEWEMTMNVIKETIEETGYDSSYIKKVDDFFSKFTKAVANSAAKLVDVSKETTEKVQKSHSPSKLAEILGEYWGEGYARGILEHTDEVKDAVTKLITEGLKVGDKVTKMSVEELKEDIAANISGSDDYENLAIELMWMDLDSLAKPQKQMEYNDSVSLEYARSLEKDIDELSKEKELLELEVREYAADLIDSTETNNILTESIKDLKEKNSEIKKVSEELKKENEALISENSKLSESINQSNGLIRDAQNKTYESSGEKNKVVSESLELVTKEKNKINEQVALTQSVNDVHKEINESIDKEIGSARTLRDVYNDIVSLLENQRGFHGPAMEHYANKFAEYSTKGSSKYLGSEEAVVAKMSEHAKELKELMKDPDVLSEDLESKWATQIALIQRYNDIAKYKKDRPMSNDMAAQITGIKPELFQQNKNALLSWVSKLDKLQKEYDNLNKDLSPIAKAEENVLYGLITIQKQLTQGTPVKDKAYEMLSKVFGELKQIYPEADITQYTSLANVIQYVTKETKKQTKEIDKNTKAKTDNKKVNIQKSDVVSDVDQEQVKATKEDFVNNMKKSSKKSDKVSSEVVLTPKLSETFKSDAEKLISDLNLSANVELNPKALDVNQSEPGQLAESLSNSGESVNLSNEVNQSEVILVPKLLDGFEADAKSLLEGISISKDVILNPKLGENFVEEIKDDEIKIMSEAVNMLKRSCTSNDLGDDVTISEKYFASNRFSGESTEWNIGGETGIRISDIIEDARKLTDEATDLFHSHPDQLSPAFSFDDILAIPSLRKELPGIKSIHTYSDKLVSTFDFNGLTDELIKEIGEKFRELAYVKIEQFKDYFVDTDKAFALGYDITNGDNYDTSKFQQDMLREAIASVLGGSDFHLITQSFDEFNSYYTSSRLKDVDHLLKKEIKSDTPETIKRNVSDIVESIGIDGNIILNPQLSETFKADVESLLASLNLSGNIELSPILSSIDSNSINLESLSETIKNLASFDLSDELTPLKELSDILDGIIQKINDKTQAFENEASVVESKINPEVDIISKLNELLSSILDRLKKISSVKFEPKKLNEQIEKAEKTDSDSALKNIRNRTKKVMESVDPLAAAKLEEEFPAELKKIYGRDTFKSVDSITRFEDSSGKLAKVLVQSTHEINGIITKISTTINSAGDKGKYSVFSSDIINRDYKATRKSQAKDAEAAEKTTNALLSDRKKLLSEIFKYDDDISKSLEKGLNVSELETQQTLLLQEYARKTSEYLSKTEDVESDDINGIIASRENILELRNQDKNKKDTANKEKDTNKLLSDRKKLLKSIYNLEDEIAKLRKSGADTTESESLRDKYQKDYDSATLKYLSNTKNVESDDIVQMLNAHNAKEKLSIDSEYQKLVKGFESISKGNYLKQYVDDANKALGKLRENGFSKTSESIKKYQDSLSELNDKISTQDSRRGSLKKVAVMLQGVNKTLYDNSAMDPGLAARYTELRDKLEGYVRAGEVGAKTVTDLAVAQSMLNSELERSGSKGKSGLVTIAEHLKSINAQFIAQYFSIQDWIRYFRQALSVITEFDTALTEMRKVSNETVASLQRYQKTTFNIATGLGTTALAVQQSTADWMRIGESLTEASKSAQAATVLMNVSEFESIDDATTSLVSMSQAYKDLSKTDIIDAVNKVGNEFSISTSGLAEALQVSAAVLATQGNDLAEAIALVTAGNAVTQDTGKTGAGIRTISLRIAGTEEAKAQLEEDGDDVADYIVQTASKTQKKIADFTKTASNKTGVNVLDDNGNLRNTYEIMLDISKVYKEIQEEDKKFGTNRASALVEYLAGKNRSNIAASILQNPEMLEDAYNAATNAAGSAAQENAKYLDSINGKVNQLKNEIQEIEYNIIDSGIIKDFLDMVNSVVSGISDVVSNIGSFTTLSTTAGSLFGLVSGITGKGIDISDIAGIFGKGNGGKINELKKTFSEFESFRKQNLTGAETDLEMLRKETDKYAQSNSKLGSYLYNVGSSADGTKASFSGYIGYLVKAKARTVALTAASAALSTAIYGIVSVVLSFAVSKIVDGINSIIDAEEIASEKAHEISESYNELKTSVDSSGKSLNQIKDRFIELSKEVSNTGNNISLTSEEFDEYHQLTNQIASMFPELIKGYDSEGEAILKVKDNVDALTEAYKNKRREANNSILSDPNRQDIFDNLENNLTKSPSIFNVVSEGGWHFNTYNQLTFLEDLLNEQANLYELMKKYSEEYGYEYTEIWDFVYDTLNVRDNLNTDTNSNPLLLVSANSVLSELEKQLNEEAKPVKDYANALLDNLLLDRDDVDEKTRSFMMSIINGLDFNDVYEKIGTESKAYTFVSKIIDNVTSSINLSEPLAELVRKIDKDIISSDNQIKIEDAIGTLFDLSDSDLLTDDAKGIANTFVSLLAQELNLDYDDLASLFGVDIIEQNYASLDVLRQKYMNGDPAESAYRTKRDDLLKKWDDSSDGLTSEEELADAAYIATMEVARQEYLDALSEYADALDSGVTDDELKEYSQNIQDVYKTYSELIGLISFDDFVSSRKINTTNEIALLNDAYEEANGNWQKAFDLYDSKFQKTLNETTSLSKWLESDENSKTAIDDYVSNMSGNLKSALEKYFDPKDNFDKQDLFNLIPEMENYVDDTDDFFSAYYKYMVAERNKLREQLENNGAGSDTISSFDTYMQGIEREGLYALGYNDDWKGQVEAYKELLSVRDELNNGGVIEQDRMVDLIKKYPDLAKAIQKSADGYVIFDDELVNVINDMASSANTAITSELTFTSNMVETIKKQISILQIGGAAWEDYWNKVNGVFTNGLGKTAGEYYTNISDFINSTYESSNAEVRANINKWRSENRGEDYVYQQLLANTPLGDYKNYYQELLDLLDDLDDSNKASKTSTEDSLSEYDYLTRHMEVLTNAVEKFQDKLDNTAGLENQVKATDELVASMKNLKQGYQDAADEYYRRFMGENFSLDGKTVNLRKNLADAIKKNGDKLNISTIYDMITNGERIDITQYSSDTASAISALVDVYGQYEESLTQVSQTTRDIVSTLDSLTEAITNQYDKILSEFDNRRGIIESDISYQTTRGYMDNVNYYKALIDNELKLAASRVSEQETLTQRYKDLQATGWAEAGFKSFEDAMQDKTFSEGFWNVKNAIDEVNNSLLDSRESISDWNREIQQIGWDVFDKISEAIDGITEESSFLIELLASNKELFTDEGMLKDEGLATFGLYVTNMRTYEAEAERIKTELTEINNDLANDPANITLLDRRNELLNQQRDLINSTEDMKSSIIDLVQEGFDKELESLQKIIDKYKEALNSEKDLYDYQKNISEKSDNIASLRKQIAAYANDTSEEAKAKLQQLTVSLNEAEEDLQDTQYERYISDQENLLDSVYETYEQYLDDAIKNTDAILSAISTKVDTNSTQIQEIITNNADKVDYDISQTLYNLIGATGIPDIQNAIYASDLDIKALNESTLAISAELQQYLNNYGLEINDGTLANTVSGFTGYMSTMNTNLDILTKDTTLETTLSEIKGILNDWRRAGESSSTSGTLSGVTYHNLKNGMVEADLDNFDYAGLGYTEAEALEDLEEKLKKYSAVNAVDTAKNTITNMLKKYGINLNGYAVGSKRIKDDEWAWTQENGQELIMRPSDGAILTPLAKGDSVFTAAATENLWNMANDPEKFIKGITNVKVPSVASVGTRGSVDNTINMSVILPSVTNYDEFVTKLQNDRKFESMIQDMTVNQLAGGSTLGKFKYKF